MIREWLLRVVFDDHARYTTEFTGGRTTTLPYFLYVLSLSPSLSFSHTLEHRYEIGMFPMKDPDKKKGGPLQKIFAPKTTPDMRLHLKKKITHAEVNFNLAILLWYDVLSLSLSLFLSHTHTRTQVRKE